MGPRYDPTHPGCPPLMSQCGDSLCGPLCSNPRRHPRDGRGLMPVRSGEAAPDFTLPGTQGRDYTLRDYRGQPVVLVFYPGDNTPVCTQQLNQYTSDIEKFVEVGAHVLAISPQSVASHEGFAC